MMKATLAVIVTVALSGCDRGATDRSDAVNDIDARTKAKAPTIDTKPEARGTSANLTPKRIGELPPSKREKSVRATVQKTVIESQLSRANSPNERTVRLSRLAIKNGAQSGNRESSTTEVLSVPKGPHSDGIKQSGKDGRRTKNQIPELKETQVKVLHTPEKLMNKPLVVQEPPAVDSKKMPLSESSAITKEEHQSPKEKDVTRVVDPGVGLSRLQRYNEIYSEYTAMAKDELVTFWFNAYEEENTLTINLGSKSAGFKLDNPSAGGGPIRLYVDRVNSILMRVPQQTFRVKPTDLADIQNRDRAALVALAGTGVAPKVYLPKLSDFDLDVGAVHGAMTVMTVVMDKPPGIALRYLPAEYPSGELPKEIALQIASIAVRRLKEIHDAGLIHGDISSWNMYWDSKSNEVTFIDFGRSMPYLDALTGDRLPEHKMKHITYEGVFFGQYTPSLNELRGNANTPNDDLFRLAETLIAVLCGQEVYTRQMNNRIRAFKESYDCTTDDRIPSEICQLFIATRNAKFIDAPIYEPFI